MTDHDHDHEHADDSPLHRPRDGYFVLSELVILARYNTDNIDKARINAWLQTLAQATGNSQYVFKLYDVEASIPVFDDGGGDPVSFLHVRVETGLNEDEAAGLIEIDTIVVNLVNALNGEISQSDAEIALLSASPNWLLCGASHTFGDGGPGGWPRPVANADRKKHNFRTAKVKEVKEAGLTALGRSVNHVGKTKPPTIEQEVNVVILDTAYPKAVIENAILRYPSNTLLPSVNNVLTVFTASSLGITMPPSPSASPHHYSHKTNYNMSDHGLFVAGLIYNWAPKAKLYLVEVLNSYGICTLQGLAQALMALLNNRILSDPTRPLIVNCSLCITFPASAVSDSTISLGLKASPTLHVKNSQVVLQALELLFSAVKKGPFPGGVRIVAAAGNDGIEPPSASYTPPSARYPAAFDEIVGAGAVEADGGRAWYSNLSDLPANGGLLVFGGKAARQGARVFSEEKEGILGLYIGHFPDETGTHPDGIPSYNGWGWWSGTSFATGVLTGMLAAGAILGDSLSLGAAVDPVEVLKSGRDDVTTHGESVLLTPQQ